MKRKYSIALLLILSVSVLLLSVSYSSYSGTIVEEESKVEDKSLRVKYSNSDLLDIVVNNETDIAITNLQIKEQNYVIKLIELNNQEYSNVYYSINNKEEQKLEDNIIYRGTLSSYGSDGDYNLNKIHVYSKTNENLTFKIIVETIEDVQTSIEVENDSE